MITWRAGARRSGRCSSWSRGQVTGGLTCRDDIIDSHTACWHYVIIVDESMFGRFRSCKGHRSRCYHRADACVAACFTAAIYSSFCGRLKQISSRICIIILLISAHPLPWYITPWEEQMTSGIVACFAIRAVQFRWANDHFIFGRDGSRLGMESWETAARMACAEAHCLGSKFYASKLYQRKAKSFKLSYINWGWPGLKLVAIYWTSIK